MKDIVYSILLAVAVVSALSNIALSATAGVFAAPNTLAMASGFGFFRVTKKSTAAHSVCPARAEYAKVSVVGDELTDLDVDVCNADGRLIAFDDFARDDCRINFYAETEGGYTIRIVNHGDGYNDYELTVKWSYLQLDVGEKS